MRPFVPRYSHDEIEGFLKSAGIKIRSLSVTAAYEELRKKEIYTLGRESFRVNVRQMNARSLFCDYTHLRTNKKADSTVKKEKKEAAIKACKLKKNEFYEKFMKEQTYRHKLEPVCGCTKFDYCSTHYAEALEIENYRYTTNNLIEV